MSTFVFVVVKEDRRLGLSGEPELFHSYHSALNSVNEYLKWYGEGPIVAKEKAPTTVGNVHNFQGDGFQTQIYLKFVRD